MDRIIYLSSLQVHKGAYSEFNDTRANVIPFYLTAEPLALIDKLFIPPIRSKVD